MCFGQCLFALLVRKALQYFLKSILILIMLKSAEKQTEGYNLDLWMVELLAKITGIEKELAKVEMDEATTQKFTAMKQDIDRLAGLDLNMLPTKSLLIQAVDHFRGCFKVLSETFISFQADIKAHKDHILERKDLIMLMELCTHMSSYVACLTHALLQQLQESFAIDAFRSTDDLKTEFEEVCARLESEMAESQQLMSILMPQLAEYTQTEAWLMTRLDFICAKRLQNWTSSTQRSSLCHLAARYLSRASQKLTVYQGTYIGIFLEDYRPLLRSYCDEKGPATDLNEIQMDTIDEVTLLQSPVQANPAWEFDDSEVINLSKRLPELLFIDTVSSLLRLVSSGATEMGNQIISLTTEEPVVQSKGFWAYTGIVKDFIMDSYGLSFNVHSMLLTPLFIFRLLVWWKVVKNSVPSTATYSIVDTLTYIEGQDNFIVAYFVVILVIDSVKLLLEKWLTTPMEQLDSATKITNMNYIRAVLFYAVLTNFFGELGSERTYASILFDTMVFELLALFDSVSSLLVAKSYTVDLGHSRSRRWSLRTV